MRKLTLAALMGALIAGPASAADIVLKAGHSANEDEPYQAAYVEMGKLLDKATGGKVRIEIYPNNQLGNEPQMMEGVLIGILDITNPAVAVAANFVPELNVLNMPFIYRDLDHMDRALDAKGPLMQKLNGVVAAKGLRLLGMWSGGIRHIMSKEPINSIADLKGKKIRVMQNPVHVATFNAFGANATPIAYGELYGALQTGVVDGAEAANTNYHAKRFYEVAGYWAMVGWTAVGNPLVMTEKKLQSLPKDVQKALLDAAASASAWERKFYQKGEDERLDELKKAGVKITKPDPTPFRTASKQIYDQYLKTPIEKELLKIIDETK